MFKNKIATLCNGLIEIRFFFYFNYRLSGQIICLNLRCRASLKIEDPCPDPPPLFLKTNLYHIFLFDLIPNTMYVILVKYVEK